MFDFLVPFLGVWDPIYIEELSLALLTFVRNIVAPWACLAGGDKKKQSRREILQEKRREIPHWERKEVAVSISYLQMCCLPSEVV